MTITQNEHKVQKHPPRELIKIVVVTGPTASGKSDLAVSIAIDRNGEVISADSRQVYRGLDIGTGKITDAEMKNIAHWGIDIVAPGENFTVANWVEYAQEKIQEIVSRGKVPIICGGTGLYIHSLVYGIRDNPKPNYELREKLKTKTLLELQNILREKCKSIESDYYENLNNSEKNNTERLIRKIEYENFDTTEHTTPLYDVEWIILNPDIKELEEKIKTRLEKRLEAGMIDEVKNLLKNGVSEKWLEELGLEYTYVIKYLKKEITENEMRTNLALKILQYAKRQNTWNKKYAK
jgi:tRNA dimethylallyltransferase